MTGSAALLRHRVQTTRLQKGDRVPRPIHLYLARLLAGRQHALSVRSCYIGPRPSKYACISVVNGALLRLKYLPIINLAKSPPPISTAPGRMRLRLSS